MTLLLFIYQVVFVASGLVTLLVRKSKGKPIPGIAIRLGIYSADLKAALIRMDRPIWLHVVSVGEVLAARPLIEILRKRFPEKKWIFTTVTPTGQELAKSYVRPGQDQLLFLPWDLSPVIRRTIEMINPALFLSFETELWPVLFHQLHLAQVPIVVVNGRISPAAYRRYLWVRPLMQRVLSKASAILTQSPQDARRYAGIGGPKDRIAVTGNLKWDLDLMNGLGESADSQTFWDLLKDKNEILWTAGSTRKGEEEIILSVYQRLRADFGNLRLLIAPRHPDRTEEIEQIASRLGLTTIRRSRLDDKGKSVPGTAKRGLTPLAKTFNTTLPRGSDPFGEGVILLDTLGELTEVYRVSDLVFIGGSLVPWGGHNLVEPAALKRPILTGPHLQNFQAIADALIQAGGVMVVSDSDRLEEGIRALINQPSYRTQLGSRAFRVIQDHRGAAAKTTDLILAKFGSRLTAAS